MIILGCTFLLTSCHGQRGKTADTVADPSPPTEDSSEPRESLAKPSVAANSAQAVGTAPKTMASIHAVDSAYIKELKHKPPVSINLDGAEPGQRLNFSDVFHFPDTIRLMGDKIASLTYPEVLAFGREFMVIEESGFGSGAGMGLYATDGSYIGEVGKFQPGSGIARRSVAIDEINSFMYLYDNVLNKIWKHRLDGTLLSEILVETGTYDRDVLSKGRLCDGIAIDSDGNLLVHYAYWDGNKVPYNYYLYSPEGKLLCTRKSFREFEGTTNVDRGGYFYEMQVYYYNDILHVKDWGDTVYAVVNNKFIPKYIISSKTSLSNIADEASYFKGHALMFDGLFETNRYLIYRCIIGRGKKPLFYWGYYDKEKDINYSKSSGSVNGHSIFEGGASSRDNHVGFWMWPGNFAYKIDENQNLLRYRLK